ncbi:ABC transporter ATP-binding protein [Vampirovibrio chlorellavorus]|uniref:ABC transporter ATP-binding protein n=1 Tax=Vampirovibrio chlorellavorus TaxID=758823 RepID=UPI0026EA32B6|nr:ABC transporter ATP-binding protein [Vampirovibrio chlorellavorus]
MSKSSPPLLCATSIQVRLQNHSILTDVSFQMQTGDFMAIIGPNGAGKSTLVKALLGLTPIADGQFTLRGQPLSSFSPKEKARHLAYVPQSVVATAFSDAQRVWDFVMMGRYPYLAPLAAPQEADRQRVAQALRQTGTSQLTDRTLSSLSGGERQKVMIAAALAQQPEILVLDEPDTFLDPKNQQEILALLSHLNQAQGLSILCVTHDLNSAAHYANRILGLKQGAVLLNGSTEETLQPEPLEALFELPFLKLTVPDRATGPKHWLVPQPASSPNPSSPPTGRPAQ